MLAKRYGYSSYLEICTPITGCTYSMVDGRQFRVKKRLMYRCPADFSDGETVDYATPADSCEELCAELIKSGESFDLVFVDPYHTYTSSFQAIMAGLQLTKTNGTLLVHDCNPPNPFYAEPEFHLGNWCGVTYAAYLDIALGKEGIGHFTVDTDFGCGIIRKGPQLVRQFGTIPDASLALEWQALDLSQKYPFFDTYRQQLLNLVTADKFLRTVMPFEYFCKGKLRKLLKKIAWADALVYRMLLAMAGQRSR